MPLLIEFSADGGGEWKQAGILKPGDLAGSVSNCQPGRRDVIMFWSEPGRSVVARSEGGADYLSGLGTLSGAGTQRVALTVQLEELASLTGGESFEMPVTTDGGVSALIRWTHNIGAGP